MSGLPWTMSYAWSALLAPSALIGKARAIRRYAKKSPTATSTPPALHRERRGGRPTEAAGTGSGGVLIFAETDIGSRTSLTWASAVQGSRRTVPTSPRTARCRVGFQVSREFTVG